MLGIASVSIGRNRNSSSGGRCLQGAKRLQRCLRMVAADALAIQKPGVYEVRCHLCQTRVGAADPGECHMPYS